MSPCKFSSPAAGVLRTAADASTPRGSASCADPRGVLLLYLKAPFCKELFARRRKRSLQLHVMLLLRTASIRAMRRLIAVRLAACCCWHRERQWRVEEANLEIFILQGSSHCLCKELVQCHRVCNHDNDQCQASNSVALRGATMLIGVHKKPRRIVIWGIKSRKIF